MRFDCACSEDGTFRCLTHETWCCHSQCPNRAHREMECPPCWLARIRSVSLSSEATPTRRGAE